MRAFALTAAVFFVCSMAYGIVATKFPRGQTYDCSLAEFSPDFPTEVKHECRKLRERK